MLLKKLEISRVMWGAEEGKFKGEAIFEGEPGSVTLNLTSEQCDKIFKVCADGIIDTAKEAAENLTCTIIEHKKLIENKS